QLDGVELNEWTSADGTRRIIVAFAGTAAVIGNDESSVVHCVQVRTGKITAVSSLPEVRELRNTVNASRGAIFGFASKSGAKSLLLAYALRSNPSSEAILGAQILSDTVGNLVEGLGWSARFVDGMVEDRCSIKLATGV